MNNFRPDLLFVVHGRKFIQRWGNKFSRYNSAVWLLDEPYEVDDTSKWSHYFNYVFVNDPNTLEQHKNAHYLPVGYDPILYRDGRAGKGTQTTHRHHPEGKVYRGGNDQNF